MPRLVTKTAHEPMLVGDKKICMCGLSATQPFCDKSHLLTKDEEDGKLYWYKDGVREEVIQESDDCAHEACDCGECSPKGCGCSDEGCKCEKEGECNGDCKGDCGKKGKNNCCGGGCCDHSEQETEE